MVGQYPVPCFFRVLGPCSGRLDRAHLGLRKQTLRRLGLSEETVWDPRIWRHVCRTHHQHIDGPWHHLWKTQLPPSVLDFAKEHDLEYLLDDADLKRKQMDGVERG